MSWLLIAVILTRIVCDLSFKGAVMQDSHLTSAPFREQLRDTLTHPLFYLGLLFGLSNVVLWFFTLMHYELSYAFPLLSVSYLGIMILGKFLFNEQIGKLKIIGIGFISLGTLVLLLS